MPIQRTPIIDDDGSGSSGTVIDNAWKQQLYDQIDGNATIVQSPMRLGPAWHGAPPAGQLNDWNLGSLGNYTAYIVTPAGNLLVTGIVAVPDMTQYLLVNASAFTLTLGQYHSGSATANRFLAPGSVDLVLYPWFSVWLLYDVSFPAWLVLKP
jgi:hypothetical protein